MTPFPSLQALICLLLDPRKKALLLGPEYTSPGAGCTPLLSQKLLFPRNSIFLSLPDTSNSKKTCSNICLKFFA